MYHFNKLKTLSTCDRADWDDPTGRAKGQHGQERGQRWKEGIERQKWLRSRAPVGGGAWKQKMGTDGGGAVNGISGIGGELARSSVRGLSAFSPQPKSWDVSFISPTTVTGGFLGGTTEGPAC